MIWKREVTLEALNAMGEGNMVGRMSRVTYWFSSPGVANRNLR